MKLRIVGLCAFALIFASPLQAAPRRNAPHIPAAQAARLVVSPRGPYTSIETALADARDGDVIEVRPGTYRGPLVVDKSVSLVGVDWPVIDGGGQGTVVTLSKAGSTLRGFEVRGSGIAPDRDHAGITLAAPRSVAEGNRLRDVLFGIFVENAADSVVRANDIASKPELDIGRKGDGVRLWYSPRALLEGNVVHDTRDVVIWYSTDVVVRDNVIERGRYGIHLMYCSGAQIERNQVIGNSVGIYTMYSDNIALTRNIIRGQRGPSGYALGFKDNDNVEVANNVLVDNRVGMYMDNTPFGQGYGRFQNNILAFNDVGVILLPAVRGGDYEGNTFWENVEQVAIQGNGNAEANTWRGNYWSDYAGFDANGDGQGDVPYRAERLFENLIDRVPGLRALLYSPASQAVEFAAAAFPLMRPQPKLVDEAPRTQPSALPSAAIPPNDGGSLAIVAAALLSLSLIPVGVAINRGGNPTQKQANPHTPAKQERRVSVHASHVTKCFGKVEALHQVSFEASAGEALALWGPNGAGKTTLAKAMLGLIDYQGEIQVEGHDVRRDGKQARRAIGYVPQEVALNDWSVRATMEFYARLKKAGLADIPALLERMGLTPHARKLVPALSGGLKQRLALAIALLGNPPVLLLDEPMANLDPQVRRDYLALLSGLRADGKTVIFASHRLEEVEALADRVLVLDQGRVTAVLDAPSLRSRAVGELDMTLWVPEAQRAEAVAYLAQMGLAAHLNGRGTVVVRICPDRKIHLLHALAGRGVEVLDFELDLNQSDAERRQPWN